MNLNYDMKITQEEKLIMTQNMQQSIKILQMSLGDLREYIYNEYAENPILEVNENRALNDDFENDRQMENENYELKSLMKEFERENYREQSDRNYSNNEKTNVFNFIEKSKSLKEYLYEQLIEIQVDEYTLNIAKYIIESLDSRGYLEISVKELSKELNVSEDEIEKGLKIVQSLEPYGIGARNIKECLLIQSSKLNILNNIVEKIILKHLENIARNRYELVAEDLNISPREAQRYGDVIKKLEPKPSRGFYTGDDVKYIIPDAEIKKINNEFFILMNENILPRLMINNTYKDVLKGNCDIKTNEYLKEKINQAVFIIKAIDDRKNTLYKILECILEKQRKFFEKGRQYLIPLTLKEVAQEVKLHESTVSRAIKDKYILTSYGTIKIKDLFQNGVFVNNEESITSLKIKNMIEKIIEEENKLKPLSDKNISNILERYNLKISRRTVAKYREEIGIKSSTMRRRL